MPEISLPTKATQDAIKEKIDLIGTPNPTTADTTTIMNYLKRLENKIVGVNGGTDWSKYTPYYKETYNTLISSAAGYVDLLNLQGEGYMGDMLVYFTSQAGSYTKDVSILVDGIEIYKEGMSTSNDIFLGMVQETTVKGGSGNAAGIRKPTEQSLLIVNSTGTNETTYPSKTDLKVGKMIYLKQPIFFNSSIVIKAKTNLNCYLRILVAGGLKN